MVSAAVGQSASTVVAASGTITGRIVDAATGLPLSGTTVAIEPLEAGAFPTRGSGGSAFIQGTRSALTGPGGEYTFRDLPPGAYRLHAQRLGYTPASVEVDLRRSVDTRLSLGLGIKPLALHPLDVEVAPPPPFLRTRSAAAEIQGARAAVEQSRQYDFLTSDVRALTHGDVVEAVTLGETDLFRALQRVPGVSARDDYTAILWTRGALWDQTRIYFDGLPLYNPTHAGWTVAGVNPEAIGVAFFHPGVRSASLGEGAAGVLDLKSRGGGGKERVQGSSELSLVSLRLAADGPIGEGRGGWMFTARRSYLDWLTQALESWTSAEDVHIPYRFTDIVARADLRLGAGWALESSILREWDRVTGDLPELLHGNRARWGNSAGRISLHSPLGPLRARHTAGMSWYSAHVRRELDPAANMAPSPVPSPLPPTAPPMNNTIAYASLGTEIEPAATPGEGPRWSAGAQLVAQGAGYDGAVYPPIPLLFAGATRLAAPQMDSGSGSYSGFPFFLESTLQHAALWGERRWAPLPGVALQSGLRAEIGEPVVNGGGVRLAPRLSARYRLEPALSLSAGWARSYQYAQAIAPAGIALGPQLHLSHLWVLAGEGVPAVRSDITTLGLERWIGSAWIASANGYLRLSSGIAMPDPTPGLLVNRPLFVEAENTARGVELSVRRLIGRWTASLGYAYGISEMEAAGMRFPGSADRRHTFDATSALRVGNSLRLGAAFSAASGAPFTRLFPGDTSRVELPSAQRTPPYATLDLLTEYTRRVRAVELSGYLQLRNALGRENAITYSGSELI
ncbi:MAG: TonB-dependent receptor, partial [Longimicrobiaceae bacterium]